MPEYVYTGPPGLYPHHRDALDCPVGAVSPGDVRDLDEPLDPSWVPVPDEGAGEEKPVRRTRRTAGEDPAGSGDEPGGQTVATPEES